MGVRMANQLPVRDHARPAPFTLLLEAGVDIVAASLAIRFTRFERMAEGLARQSPAQSFANEETAYWLRRAVSAWGRRLPWRARCFEQGIAGARMLKRRGLAYELHYGAASRGERLEAHVWLLSGSTPVVGCENSSDFASIARFAG
jgi:hypothetical protein